MPALSPSHSSIGRRNHIADADSTRFASQRKCQRRPTCPARTNSTAARIDVSSIRWAMKRWVTPCFLATSAIVAALLLNSRSFQIKAFLQRPPQGQRRSRLGRRRGAVDQDQADFDTATLQQYGYIVCMMQLWVELNGNRPIRFFDESRSYSYDPIDLLNGCSPHRSCRF